MHKFSLELFTVTIETRRLTSAAKALNITQSAVSQQIKQMEAFFGVPLLERGTHGVTPTATGEIFYRHAKLILAQFECMEREIDDQTNEDEREVSIGATPTVGNFVLPCSLWTFNDKFPKARLNLEVGGVEEMAERVLKRTLHLAILEGPVPEQAAHVQGIKSRCIAGDHLVFVTPAKGRWAKGRLTLDRLRQVPLILPGRGTGIPPVLENALANQGLEMKDLQVKSMLGGWEGLKTAMETHGGVMLGTRMSVQKELQRGTYRDVTPPELRIAIPFHLICFEEQLPPVARRFIRFIAAPEEMAPCWTPVE